MDEDEPDDSEPEMMLCPKCFTPIESYLVVCPACRRHIDPTYAFTPFGQIESLGDGLSGAAYGRPSRAVLIGSWMLLLPLVGVTALDFVQSFGMYQWTSGDLLNTCFQFLYCLGGALLLSRITSNYVDKSRAAAAAEAAEEAAEVREESDQEPAGDQ